MLATVIFLRRDLVRIVAAWFRGLFSAGPRQDPDCRFGWAIILGSIPIGVVGLLFQDTIETTLRSLWFVAGGADPVERGDVVRRSRGHPDPPRGRRDVEGHPDHRAWCSALALIPGVSRSGATMSAGLLRDFDRVTVTKLSFFLSIPALLGATVLQAVTAVRQHLRRRGLAEHDRGHDGQLRGRRTRRWRGC